MKKTMLLSAIAGFFLLMSCNGSGDKAKDSGSGASDFKSIDTTALAAGTEFYQCPMHPQYTSDKEGKCPECEMDLEKRVKK